MGPFSGTRGRELENREPDTPPRSRLTPAQSPTRGDTPWALGGQFRAGGPVRHATACRVRQGARGMRVLRINATVHRDLYGSRDDGALSFSLPSRSITTSMLGTHAGSGWILAGESRLSRSGGGFGGAAMRRLLVQGKTRDSRLGVAWYGLLVAGSLWGSSWAGAAAPVADKVRPVVPIQAIPFNLEDVRLLPGPFRHAMELDQKYILALDVDRLLHSFRLNAGLPSTARPLGGWEAPKGELRGHFTGHYLSACAHVCQHRGRPLQGQGRPACRRTGGMPAEDRLGIPECFSRDVHRSCRESQAGLGALVHLAQDPGWPARYERALWQRPGAGGGLQVRRLGQGPHRPAQ